MFVTKRKYDDLYARYQSEAEARRNLEASFKSASISADQAHSILATHKTSLVGSRMETDMAIEYIRILIGRLRYAGYLLDNNKNILSKEVRGTLRKTVDTASIPPVAIQPGIPSFDEVREGLAKGPSAT
jgi:hypothetical protein